jgi:hypothetical protein
MLSLIFFHISYVTALLFGKLCFGRKAMRSHSDRISKDNNFGAGILPSESELTGNSNSSAVHNSKVDCESGRDFPNFPSTLIDSFPFDIDLPIRRQQARVSFALSWAQIFERQICLELVRNATVGIELSVLAARSNSDYTKHEKYFSGYQEIVDVLLARINTIDLPLVKSAKLSLWQEAVINSLRNDTLYFLNLLRNSNREAFIKDISIVANPDYLFLDSYGTRIESNTETTHWGMWYPGLKNNHLTLATVLNSMPKASAADIPDEVKELENPFSPNAKPGAVTLKRHDPIHALLGRGLLDQDEAFVIGFTMGNASKYKNEDGDTIKVAFADTYPEPYRIYGEKLNAFDLGVSVGKKNRVRDIADIPIEDMSELTLGELRERLGISIPTLQIVYQEERRLLPSTLESGRLPV